MATHAFDMERPEFQAMLTKKGTFTVQGKERTDVKGGDTITFSECIGGKKTGREQTVTIGQRTYKRELPVSEIRKSKLRVSEYTMTVKSKKLKLSATRIG